MRCAQVWGRWAITIALPVIVGACATTPRDAATRLETLCLMNDVGLPLHVARTQVASALNIVLSIARLSDGSRRVQAISEVLELDDRGQYAFRDIFRFHAKGRDAEGKILGELRATGERPSFADEPYTMGYESDIKLTTDIFQRPVTG